MLSRTNRIESRLFPSVTRGKVLQNDSFRVVIRLDSGIMQYKCAVIVPNKVAKTAVVRNKIRRQVYSAIRDIAHLKQLPIAFITIFPKSNSLPYEKIHADLAKLF